MITLAKGCVQADFVVSGPWRVPTPYTKDKTRYARVVRRVFSNGSSILELQEDWQDAGSCADQFRPVVDHAVALNLALQILAQQGETSERTA